MSVSSISNIGITPPSVPSTTSTPLTGASSSSVAVAAPVDSVTLSQAAQQSLAAAAPADGSSQPDAVTQAIAALNDTSGSTSVTDQIQAYSTLANFVEGPQYVAWMANAVPGESGPENDFTAAKGNAIVAMIDSPFAQHAQQVLNTVNVQYMEDSGDEMAAAINSNLARFNALSSTDQQIYLGLTSLGQQLEGRQYDLTTADDYRANQQAQAGAYQALQAAISSPIYAPAIRQAEIPIAGETYSGGFEGDLQALTKVATAAGDQATLALINLYNSSNRNTTEWTQQAQAYFAQYGTPPALDSATSASLLSPAAHLACYNNPTPDGATLAAALSASWNTTGNASITDQTNALATVWEYFASNKTNSPALMAIGTLSESPFQQQANAAAQNFFWSPAVQAAASGNDDPFTTPSELALLNKLPLQQQQLIFAGSSLNLPNEGFEGGQNIYYATLDDWKSALAQHDATNRAAWQGQQSSAATSASSAAATVAAAVSAAASTPPAANSTTAATSQAARALANLTAKTPVYSSAEIALTVLQNASKAAEVTKAANNHRTGYTANASAGASTVRRPGASNLRAPHYVGNTVSVTA